MTNLEIIQKIKESTFTDEDGEDYKLEFQDGLNNSEIKELKKRFPSNNIDEELIEILKETRGWDGYGPEMVYFDSIGEFGFWELSKNSITLGHDGFGNSWILDIDENGIPGKVFFACHDPAVFVIHSQNVNEFLIHLLEFYQSPAECHMTTVNEKTIITIWDNNKFCSPKAEFISKNKEYEEYLRKFDDEEWTIADIRKGQNNDGFAWGKFGSNNFTERHPTDLVWIIKNKRKGFLSRLFGK